jgi:hypothetical protein
VSHRPLPTKTSRLKNQLIGKSWVFWKVCFHVFLIKYVVFLVSFVAIVWSYVRGGRCSRFLGRLSLMRLGRPGDWPISLCGEGELACVGLHCRMARLGVTISRTMWPVQYCS